MRTRLALFAGVALVATGCFGGGKSENEALREPGSECSGKPASPLTAQRTAAVLRRHGFQARVETAAHGCYPDIAAVVTNETPDVAVLVRDGWLYCSVAERHRGRDGGEVASISAEGERGHAEEVLANLECVLEFGTDRRADQRTRFEAALDELRSAGG